MPAKIQKVPKRQLVEEYLIVHRYATNAQVAAACGVSEGTVSNARRDAVKKGLLEPAYFDRSSPPLETESPTSTGSVDTVTMVQEAVAAALGRGGKPLDPEESLSMLATMTREAYTKKNFSLVRDCILADAKIREKTEDTNLTIPDPLTDEEFIKHTSDILDCIGPRLAAESICHAFDFSTRLAFEEEFGRIKATRAPAETPGAKIAATPLEGPSNA